MGIDYTADLGYGFLVEDEDLITKFCEEGLEVDKFFDLSFGGDAYAGDMQTFIFVKKSAKDTWSGQKHEDPIKKRTL